MAELTVDRLHTRYLGAAARHQDCLRRMLDVELDPALAAVSLPAGHVCVRRLTVPVRLDPGATGPAGLARSWAAQLAAGLARTIATDGAAVVYPRILDALVDLLVSLGRGDRRRAWAWAQLGLLPAGPEHPDAVAALLTRPELICAALAAAAPHAPVPLAPAGWVTVAAAAARPAGDPAPGGPLLAHPETVLVTPLAGRLPAEQVAALPAEERRAVARLLLLTAAPALSRSLPAITSLAARLARPDPPGSSAGTARSPFAAGQADEPPPAPGVTPSRTAAPSPGGAASFDIPEAVSASAGDVSVSNVGVGPGAVISPPSDTPASASRPAAPSIPDPGPPASPAGEPAFAQPAALLSPAAGVLFLIAATGIPDLRAAPPPLLSYAQGAATGPLAAHPLPAIVARLAARLSEASPDDPALHVLAGAPPHPPPAGPGIRLGVPESALSASRELGSAPGVGGSGRAGPGERLGVLESALSASRAHGEEAELADRVRAWLRELMGLEPDDDLRWLWRRPARIAAEPGWVEATFALDDVDIRVRRAGLDLDPGFVWWLGAVVRYRYV